MSNALSVPAVTAALVTLVQAAVDTAGLTPGPVVSVGTLEDSGDHARVSVHLYRVSRHDALSNETLPLRSSTGALRARPTVALDLHYLLCFRGDSELDAQTMMAISAVTVEANPLVGTELLELTVTDHPEVAGHDLRDALTTVHFTPDALSVDELTKMWALYPAGSFALTLAVSAGPLLVEAVAAPTAGLPVQALALGAHPLGTLRLDAVGGPAGPGAQVRAAAPMPDLVLHGAGLAPAEGETVRVLLDGAEVVPTSGDDAHLVVPSSGLLPGAHRVQVRKSGPPLDPALSSTPTSRTSETRVAMVVPALDAATVAAGTVSATVQPPVARGTVVRLLLDPVAGGASVAVTAATLPIAATTAVSFDVSDVDPGTYRLTVEVGGVRSLPTLDPAGHYQHREVTL